MFDFNRNGFETVLVVKLYKPTYFNNFVGINMKLKQ